MATAHASCGAPPPPPTVLFVGGWSPGPWIYLESFLKDYYPRSSSDNNNSIRPMEILELNNIPMPPFVGNWLCNWDVMGIKTMVPLGLILFAVFYIIPRFIHNTVLNVFVYLIVILYVVAWCRWFAAIVVRTSIQKGVEICFKEISHIRQQQSQQNPSIIVIGFSWGGAVVAEMIAQNMIEANDPRVSALLIAPTTALVAKIAKEKDPALRITMQQQQQLDANKDPLLIVGSTDTAATNTSTTTCHNIHVVHGTLDHAFCPHQNRWEGTLATLHRVHDNHVFCTQSSSDLLTSILNDLILRQQRQQ